MLRNVTSGPGKDPESSSLDPVWGFEERCNVSIPCLLAARMGRESELPNAVGNCSMGDFVSEVLVTVTPCFRGSCEENVFFLRRCVRANNFLRYFVKSFLGECGTVVFLKSPEGKVPAERE